MPNHPKPESHRRHYYKSPTYLSWAAMKDRCLRVKNVNYPNYGAIGITICEEWMYFSAFLRDMGPRPAGKTLDRIDPNGNYTKENCRWADSKTQGNNKRYNFSTIVENEAGF